MQALLIDAAHCAVETRFEILICKNCSASKSIGAKRVIGASEARMTNWGEPAFQLLVQHDLAPFRNVDS